MKNYQVDLLEALAYAIDQPNGLNEGHWKLIEKKLLGPERLKKEEIHVNTTVKRTFQKVDFYFFIVVTLQLVSIGVSSWLFVMS